MRETKYKAIILKKQQLGEGDEIVSFYTKEAGKIRAVAKSSKFAKSKMQHALQVLFLVQVTLAHSRSSLSKIIGSEVCDAFIGIRENLTAAAAALYAQEITLKFTADSQVNEQLFEVVKDFLTEVSVETESRISLLLAQFKIRFLSAVGFAIEDVGSVSENVFFAPTFGGFSMISRGVQDEYIPVSVYMLFFELSQNSRDRKHIVYDEKDLLQLQRLLSSCVEYQLERGLHSEKMFAL